MWLMQNYILLQMNGTVGSELFKLEQSALSIEEETINQLSKINAFPNPTIDILNLKVDNQQIKSIKIYNLMGKEVFSKSTSNLELKNVNISKLSGGMYILKVKTDKKTFTNKIIKK